MGATLICLLSCMVGQPGVVQSDRALGLHGELELATREALFGDPVFARVAVANYYADTMPLPASVFGTAGYTAGTGFPYTYQFSTVHDSGNRHFHPFPPARYWWWTSRF